MNYDDYSELSLHFPFFIFEGRTPSLAFQEWFYFQTHLEVLGIREVETERAV